VTVTSAPAPSVVDLTLPPLTLPAPMPPALTAAERIADAALRCIAEQGIKATTVEAIAVEAGVGRATVYRHFPGGRAEVILAAGHRELERFAAMLTPECDAAATLEDLLVVAVRGAHVALSTSGPIQELLEREPELVLPHLGFDRMPDVFVVAADLMGPHLRRFVADDRAANRLAEWVTRLVLSHHLVPAADVDLDDRDAVRAHLRQFVLPGLSALSPTPT
jgi:AcrR family transcriptional regulator